MEEKLKKLDVSKRIITFVVIVLSILIIGTAGFMIIGFSLKDSFMMTLESLSFMFRTDSGAAKVLEILLAIFGVITLGWILTNFLEIFTSGSFTEYLKTSLLLSNMKKMRNHYIIAGGGRVGEEIASKLRKTKKQYIIIEKDSNKVEKLKKRGFNVITGDVTDSDYSDLIDAGIKNAKTIISTLPETEKNLLFTMSAKEINPKIDVFARADNPAFVSKLKKAGAKTVVVPEITAAERFLEAIDK